MSELPQTLAEMAELVRSRKVSPVELVQHSLGQIDAFDSKLHTMVTRAGEHALVQARAAEAEIAAGRYRGALHGVPYGVKDVISTAGILTMGNSRVGADNIPAKDAGVVRRLNDAGACMLGKTTTWEMAHSVQDQDAPWPEARNPWNLNCSTNGSSSGSAAAVAAGLMPFALGTDTGGSVRGPASYNGVAGLKATYGLVSRAGIITNSFNFDYCGPLAWTVEDCALVLSAIAGFDQDDPSSCNFAPVDYRSALKTDLKGLRIGVLRHFWEEDLSLGATLNQAMEEALAVLTGLGAKLSIARIRPIQHYYDVKTIVAESEIFSVHQRDLIDRPSAFGLDFLARTTAGCLFSGADYVQAQRLRRVMIDEMAELYEKFDVLVTCGLGPAAEIKQPEAVDYRNKWSRPNPWTPFNVIGGPALALCNGFSSDGLPLSMQIVGRPFDESTVLRVGHAYEKATPWRGRRPGLTEGSAIAPTTPSRQKLPDAEPKTRELVHSLAKRAGLSLPEDTMAILCDVAPFAFAMADRIPRHRNWHAEPATTSFITSPFAGTH